MATKTQRSLAVMEAVKGGTVTGAEAIKWATYFAETYYTPGEGDPAVGDLTNDQLAHVYIEHLREHHRQVRQGKANRDSAADLDTLHDAANAETDTDLGPAEPMPEGE